MLSEDPVELSSTVVPAGLRLRLRQQYRFVEDDDVPTAERWHVSTVAYQYRLDHADGTELLSWHWHPSSRVAHPHMHTAAGSLPLAAHLPTGRVSIESVLRLLLADLGVPARNAKWREVFDEAEDRFLAYRRWSGRSPRQG